jgi:thiamine biosynthesis protein ThiS
MRVLVNGFAEEFKSGTRISEIIDQFQAQDHSLIVEHNGRFVYPDDYTRKLKDGDRVELIHPAFGG